MGRTYNSVPANGRKACDIPYEEFPAQEKTCRACKETKPITHFQKIVSNKGHCSINSWCKSCKSLANSKYNQNKVVVLNSPVPSTCKCGNPCKPINHYEDWLEMECSRGHLWYHPREFSGQRSMVLSYS